MRKSLQPTTPHPAPDTLPLVLTYALTSGDLVWTQSGPREVLSVEPGNAGGWCHVMFEDGVASVVYTHPWIVAELCSANRGADPASGCDEWALQGADYCAAHNYDADGVLIGGAA